MADSVTVMTPNYTLFHFSFDSEHASEATNFGFLISCYMVESQSCGMLIESTVYATPTDFIVTEPFSNFTHVSIHTNSVIIGILLFPPPFIQLLHLRTHVSLSGGCGKMSTLRTNP